MTFQPVSREGTTKHREPVGPVCAASVPTVSIALSVALAVALSGCGTALTARPQGTGDGLPVAWSVEAAQAGASAAGDGQALSRWWAIFGDPVLVNLVDQALAANTSVLAAQASWHEARALRDVAAAALWPSLGLTASAGRARSSGVPAHNAFGVGVDAGWELDLFGMRRSARDVADATAQASGATLGDVQVSIAAEVALDYITLRDTQARLAIARDNLQVQQETLQITQWRWQAGLLTALEAEQARAGAEQTAALLPPLQTGIELSSHALAVLTGQPPAALLATLGSVAPLPQVASGASLSPPAQTLRQRADVRAAEWQVSAALSRVDQAQAARAPNFQLSGSLGLSALTLGALGDGASVASSLLAAVTLPLFDGGALRAQLEAQQAGLDVAVASYRATVLGALQDVEDALVTLRDTRVRLVSLQRAAEAAANASQMARQRYSSGLVDFQTVLETQRTQLTTQDAVASAGAALSSGHVRLYKALGGGWPADGMDEASRVSLGDAAPGVSP